MLFHTQPNIRQCGETALAQLIFGQPPLAAEQQTELAEAILKADWGGDPAAAYCLTGAYWKTRLRGYFEP